MSTAVHVPASSTFDRRYSEACPSSETETPALCYDGLQVAAQAVTAAADMQLPAWPIIHYSIQQFDNETDSQNSIRMASVQL